MYVAGAINPVLHCEVKMVAIQCLISCMAPGQLLGSPTKVDKMTWKDGLERVDINDPFRKFSVYM